MVFFDTETTGLDPMDNTNQIIELAAYALHRDSEHEEMDDFISLQGERCILGVPEKITELTGIDDTILFNDGIDELDALDKFMAMIKGDSLLVAYNAHFDLLYLCMAILRHRKERPGFLKSFNACDYLDPCSIHRDRARNVKSHKLEAAISYFGLDGEVVNSHRAIDDTKALIRVSECLNNEKEDFIRYINFFSWVRQPPEHPLKKVTYFDLSPWHHPPGDPLYKRTR